MANPFEKRASEYRRDDEAFLPLVTPDPLITFFKKHADDGKLYAVSYTHLTLPTKA